MDQKEFTTPAILPFSGSVSCGGPEPTNLWCLVSTGIWERVLNESGENRSLLQWWEPGAKTQADVLITHSYIEEVILLEGELRDLRLGETWGKGAYAYRLPGMEHGPYVAGDEGCYMFVKTVVETK